MLHYSSKSCCFAAAATEHGTALRDHVGDVQECHCKEAAECAEQVESTVSTLGSFKGHCKLFLELTVRFIRNSENTSIPRLGMLCNC